MGRRAPLALALVASVIGVSAGVAPAGTAGWHLQGASTGRSAHARPTRVVSALEQGVLSNVNALRREHGLAPLRLSQTLTEAARSHSTEMAERGYFSHDSANGKSFDRRIARYYSFSGRHYWSVGENLLWASPDVDARGALNLWLDSPPHREILLTSRWREIGLSAVHVTSAPGTYGGREVTIVTADFGVRH